MKNHAQLVLYAVGGIFVVLLIYSLRDYLVIALVSAGAVYLYQLTNNHQK